MKKLIARIVILLMLLLILNAIACGNNEKETQSTPALQDDGLSIELDGTQWALVSINGGELIEGSHISLYFRDGSVWGYAGCNIYGGDYSTEDRNILKIPEIIQTAMGCFSREGVLEQEEEYVNTLLNSTLYSGTDNKLEIYNSGNQKLLVFERKQEFAMNPADLVGTSWQLVSINGAPVLEGLSITLTFDSDSEASGHAGCFDYVLPYTATGDDIRCGISVFPHTANGDDIQWGMIAKSDCELPRELRSQGLSYTSTVMWGANYRLTAEQLEIFTAKGDILVYDPLEALDGGH